MLDRLSIRKKFCVVQVGFVNIMFSYNYMQPLIRKMTSATRKWNGKVIADICVVPLGTSSPSVSEQVAHVERIFARFPLKTSIHANGTSVEGSWDDVSSAIKAMHEEVHASGIERIHCNMRWGSRTDKTQTMEEKVSKLQSLLAGANE